MTKADQPRSGAPARSRYRRSGRKVVARQEADRRPRIPQGRRSIPACRCFLAVDPRGRPVLAPPARAALLPGASGWPAPGSTAGVAPPFCAAPVAPKSCPFFQSGGRWRRASLGDVHHPGPPLIGTCWRGVAAQPRMKSRRPLASSLRRQEGSAHRPLGRVALVTGAEDDGGVGMRQAGNRSSAVQAGWRRRPSPHWARSPTTSGGARTGPPKPQPWWLAPGDPVYAPCMTALAAWSVRESNGSAQMRLLSEGNPKEYPTPSSELQIR